MPRPPRPNYRVIHAKPLPLDVFPLPPLIPHNPLSVLHIAYVYLYQLIARPSSHPRTPIKGHYHPESNSVHVTGERSIRLLWERGFFGKGSLSRSEPTWLDREKKRLGLVGTDTSEEYTQQRREERRKMKLDRALKEREAVEETLRRERQGQAQLEEGGMTSESAVEDRMAAQMPPEDAASPLAMAIADHEHLPTSVPDAMTQGESSVSDTLISATVDEPMPEQQEHLQLCPEEAFFLTFGLGVLEVSDASTDLAIPTGDLLLSLRANFSFPPTATNDLTPFDPFLLSYVVYHHYRSLGWVVRPGIKFAVDWLLYFRGPVFAHAEFAVVIIPSFRDEYWWTDERRLETERRSKRDWWWFHCSQRVQAHVKKGLIFCWVEIPRQDQIKALGLSKAEMDTAEAKGMGDGYDNDIGKALRQYKVRDMYVRRWLPNRNRD